MRVLHVIPSLRLTDGGPARAVLAMEAALRQRGIDVTIATTRQRQVPDGDDGQDRRFFPRATEAYKFAPAFLPWAWRHVRDYDLVHVHALFSFVSNAAAAVARRRGVPYIVRPLGTLNRYGMTHRRGLKQLSFALLESAALRHAACVHFTSDDESAQTRALLPAIDLRGAVIPVGLEAPISATPAAARAQFALGDAPYLLFLGRLNPVKNIDGMLRAFALVRQQRPSLRFVIAGPGQDVYAASLRKLSEDLGVASAVTWTGPVDGAEKANLLAGAELFMLCSHSESFGIAAAEALMAGIPCVLGAGVAIAHEVALADAGVIADVNTPGPLAESVLQALADPGRLRAMRAHALEFASSRYSLDAMGRSLETLYRGILSGATGKPAASRIRRA